MATNLEKSRARLRVLLNQGGLMDSESKECLQLAALLGVRIQMTRIYFDGRDPVIIYESPKEENIDNRSPNKPRRPNSDGAQRNKPAPTQKPGGRDRR